MNKSLPVCKIIDGLVDITKRTDVLFKNHAKCWTWENTDPWDTRHFRLIKSPFIHLFFLDYQGSDNQLLLIPPVQYWFHFVSLLKTSIRSKHSDIFFSLHSCFVCFRQKEYFTTWLTAPKSQFGRTSIHLFSPKLPRPYCTSPLWLLLKVLDPLEQWF